MTSETKPDDRCLWSVLDDLTSLMIDAERGAAAIEEFALNGMDHQIARNQANGTKYKAEIQAESVHWMAVALSAQLERAKALVKEASERRINEARGAAA